MESAGGVESDSVGAAGARPEPQPSMRNTSAKETATSAENAASLLDEGVIAVLLRLRN